MRLEIYYRKKKKHTQIQEGETTCYQTTNQSLKKSKEKSKIPRDKSQ